MDNSWFEKLKENSEKYKAPIWTNMSEKERARSAQETVDILRDIASTNKLRVRFQGEVLEFEPLHKRDLRVKVKSDKSILCDGSYNARSNTLSVSKNALRWDDGRRVFETVAHEFTHKIEHALIKHRKQYKDGSLERQYLKTIKRSLGNKQMINAFGMDCGKWLYVDSHLMPNNYMLNKRCSMFYGLSTVERHAFSFSQRLCERFFDTPNQMDYTNAVDIFRKTYHCINWSHEDIAKTMDGAMSYVANGTPLNNAFEAIVAYDFAVAMALQNRMIGEAEYKEMQTEQARAAAIEKAGYKLPWKSAQEHAAEMHSPDGLVCDLELLRRMSAEEQLANPEYICQVAMVERKRTIDAIKDMDAFKSWYYSEANAVPDPIQADLAIYLGKEFSPQFRREMMENRGMSVEENMDWVDWGKVQNIKIEVAFDGPNDIKYTDEHGFDIER